MINISACIRLMPIGMIGLISPTLCSADSATQMVLDKATVTSLAPIPSAVPGTVIIKQSSMWREDMRKQAVCYFLVKGGSEVVVGNTIKVPPEDILGFNCNQD